MYVATAGWVWVGGSWCGIYWEGRATGLVRCWLHSHQRVLSPREVPTRKCRTKTVWDIISLIPQDPFYLKFFLLNLGQNAVSFDFIYGARFLFSLSSWLMAFPGSYQNECTFHIDFVSPTAVQINRD